MSHTNSTANYQLPQFLGTDKPAWLTDVNQAFSDIDTAMKANEVSAGQANALATQNASAISTQSGQISTLTTKVTALETAQPTDEAQIETNRQNIATNAQNIVEIDNRLGHTSIASIGDGTVTGAIDDLQSQIDAIPTPTTPTANDITYDNTSSGLSATKVQGAIDEVNSTVKALDTAVDALEVAVGTGTPVAGTTVTLTLNTDYTAPKDGYLCISAGAGEFATVYLYPASGGTIGAVGCGHPSSGSSNAIYVRKGMRLRPITLTGNAGATFIPFTF